MLALEFGRLLMEAGASARDVEEIIVQVATGLGAERTELRVGYASLAITIGIGPDGITRMCKANPLGVNQSLDDALRGAAARIERGDCTQAEARAELDRLVRATPRHADWVVTVAVGVAPACLSQMEHFRRDRSVGLSG
ncbi:MAG: threonine/serine exporter family protein [Acidobacteriota bacterium]